MNVFPPESWKTLMEAEFHKSYYKALETQVNFAYKKHVCYPPQQEIFNAFHHFKPEETKVVLIGQDPYHGANQANGLCFSVHDGVPHPPSLKNIFKELETDIHKPYPASGDLLPWAKQGVLLLNATLSVEEGSAGSHQKFGWEKFTDAVIKNVSDLNQGLVFLLWGGFAKKKIKFIDQTKHYVLQTGHPSPLSANRGFWFGNQHFSKTNNLLQQQNKKPIKW